jgi:serine/threonine protein kinase/Tol biopolymer transport system component
MDPERWQQIDQLFHSALKCEPAARATFLQQACIEDEALRHEVASLVESHELSDSFIEEPATDLAAELLAGTEEALAAGQTVGPYKIVSLLGEGGMGEVYLAQDERLGRQVALKLLPAQFMRDADRVRRFEQEARAVSALNHPNIVTIHEIGNTNSLHFITTEFIDGETLREHMVSNPLNLDEVLDIATQIASALAAAHAARIVHRDIKPENIMIRPDGYVKVLDFGLAKLIEQDHQTFLGLEDPTAQQNLTAKGVILGTVNYMSPEQAKGGNIDERSDIFSLGVVLYEMITGRKPFAGDSLAETFANLVNLEPPPLSRFVSNPPDDLRRIVSKTLRKNKDERYQTMKDVLIDLKDLRTNMTSEEKLARSYSLGGENPTVAFQATTGEAKQRTAETQQSLLQKIKLHKKTALGVAAVLLAAVASGYYILNRPKAALVFQAGEVKRLTTTGRVSQATISPDGKFVIYAQKENGDQESLWLQHVGSENNLQINPPAKIEYQGLDITPDGNTLYYTDGQLSLYRMGVVGGRSMKVADSVGSPAVRNHTAVSPDGSQIAFVRRFENDASAIFIANADGTNERRLAAFELLYRLNGEIAWSPDGKIIACWFIKAGIPNILAVRVADGTWAPISAESWADIRDVTWMVDSKSLFVAGLPDVADAPCLQIWQISYPSGKKRQITNDLNNYQGLGLTADGQFLTALRTDQSAFIWMTPDRKESFAKQFTAGFEKLDGTSFLGWLPDNRIVYDSLTSGRYSSWVIGMDGTDPQRLADNSVPVAISPDGNYLIHGTEDIDGNDGWWRMELRNGSQKPISGDQVYSGWTFSPDGKWIVFTRYADRVTLMKMLSEGGEPTQVLGENVSFPAFSPDGKTIAVTGRAVGWGIALVSFDGGKIIAKFDARPESDGKKINLQWTPDGRAINYVALNNGVSNIWRQPIDGGPPVQVTKFETGRIFNFAYSADGKQLALSRGTLNSDVVLIKNSGFVSN